VEDLKKAKPVLKHFRGWKSVLKECRSFDDLPEAAQNYVNFIEEYCSTRIGIISVGYERNDTFMLHDPWSK